MAVEFLADRIQSEGAQTLTSRYEVVQKTANAALEYTAEQPKQVLSLFQALGVGHSVDVIV